MIYTFIEDGKKGVMRIGLSDFYKRMMDSGKEFNHKLKYAEFYGWL